MKRNAGIFAGAAAVVMLYGASMRNRGSSGVAIAPHSNERPAVSLGERAGRGSSYTPCDEIANRLQRFLKNPSEGRQTPSSAFLSPCNTRQKVMRGETHPGVHFLIATAPNPVSTQLPLLFDRIVGSVQQAAEDVGYSYEDSWFPWEETAKDYVLLGDQLQAEKRKDDQEGQPGVIVFRRAVAPRTPASEPYENGLIAFVVGEKPTGGISDDQFDNALRWIRLLKGPDPFELKILGPAFSGSLPSLRSALIRNLDDPATLQGLKGKLHIEVSSGNVSSAVNYSWFENWISGSQNGVFWTAMADDAKVSKLFCQYLDKQGYGAVPIAELSEGGTAFGSFFAQSQLTKTVTRESPGCPQLMIYYPRDIGTMRSAYEQQSIFNSVSPESKENAPSSRLRGNLSEPSGAQHDAVRHYGGSLTSVAQESILMEVTSRLREDRAQFIILRSTNPLDQIFLSEFLRRTYPEGRIVIDYSDRLFTEGNWGRSMRGVMMLSSYPLLTLEPDPSSFQFVEEKRRVFDNETTQGVYIAGRRLFAAEPEEPYRQPVWLSVVGHRRFWPLAIINEHSFSRSRSEYPPHLGRFPTVMWVLVGVSLVWGIAHLYLCVSGSVVRPPRQRSYFVPMPRWEHPTLIAFGSFLIAWLALTVAAGAGWLLWNKAGEGSDRWCALIVFAVCCCVLSSAFIATRRNYQSEPLGSGEAGPASVKRWHRRAALAAITVWLLLLILHVLLLRKLTLSNGIPAYWRSLNILSGVSPLLPQLLLVGGMYAWFCYTLRGLAHFGGDRPVLPREIDLPLFPSGLPASPATPCGATPMMPMFGREKASDPIERLASPLERNYCTSLAIFLVLTAIGCRLALHEFSLRTLGELSYGRFVFWWLCVCIAAIFANTLQFWRVWVELRRLLIHLDRLPLRRALRALTGLEWGSIWRMTGNVLEERYRVISLQVESLRHLRNTQAPPLFSLEASVKAGTAP